MSKDVFMGADPNRTYVYNSTLSATSGAPTYSIPTTPCMSILEEAQQLVYGPREKAYAHPKVDFKRAVGMLNALFESKLKEPLTETDWALVMIVCKVARLAHDGQARDGWVDVAGYAETGARVAGIDK